MTVILLLLILMTAGPSRGASGGAGAAAFLDEGMGARWLGMGGAASAAAWDSTAAYWNPAGLTKQGPTVWQVGTMLSSSTLGRSSSAISGSCLTDRAGTWGLAWMRSSVSGLESVDDTGNITGKDSDTADALLLSWARPVIYQVRAGATVKFAREQLFGFSASGVTGDLGLLVQPFLEREFYLAGGIRNAGGTWRWSTGRSDRLARAFVGGASLRFWKDRILLAGDAVSRDGLPLEVAAGVEGWLFPELALRAGWGRESPAGGATYLWKPYELDYAFVWDGEDLGNSHRFSLLLHF
jgi:hypothetical protein